MARTEYRDEGKGRRRGFAGFITSALCLLLLAGLPACGLDSPSSPNQSGNLTGQTTNQVFTFSGSIGLSTVSGTVVADDRSTVTIIATVRDASGNPVPNLTRVTFSTDLGGFLAENNEGDLEVFSTLQASTFGGVASAAFASFGGITGTATIRASLGQVSSSTTVDIEPAPVSGSLALSFGPDGEGMTIMTGTASTAQPLDIQVGVTALDADGEPIIGATVEFHFAVDTTGTGDFVTGDDVLTGPNGTASNLLRVSGAGDIAIEASLIDPNTGDVVAVSNRIFLTTRVVTIITLAFNDGTTTTIGTGGAFSRTVVATVTDTEQNPQEGFSVRFSIVDDSTADGAALSTTLAFTDAEGKATAILAMPANTGMSDETVTILAEIIGPTGEVISTSNTVVVINQP